MFQGKSNRRFREVDGKYQVSDDGLVWSRVGGDLMPLEPIGGVGVNLHGKRVKICYLVARAFVPNGECREWVRHKNGDRTDNRAENLEWSDVKEEGRRGRKSEVRWIKAWRLDGEVAGVWGTVAEAAAEMGVKPGAIRACLNGRQKMAGGMLWRDL